MDDNTHDLMDEQPRKRAISEISHLFLSNVRELHAAPGVARPLRRPPGAAPVADGFGMALPAHGSVVPPSSLDPDAELTAEEFDATLDPSARRETATATEPEEVPPIAIVTAVIAPHLGARQLDRVRQYARHVATRIGRIGLIEADAAELRVMCFEPGRPLPHSPGSRTDCYDPRQIAEAIEELNWDVEQWLLVVPNPRTPEAKELLQRAGHWVLLTTADHDGVVSGYRALKGLIGPERPRLSLALLDADSPADAARIHAKLAGVCGQFLDCDLEMEPSIAPAPLVAEHLSLLCRTIRDKAQTATTAHWSVLADFISRSRQTEEDEAGRSSPSASAAPAAQPAGGCPPAHAVDSAMKPPPAPQSAAPAAKEPEMVAPNPAHAAVASPTPSPLPPTAAGGDVCTAPAAAPSVMSASPGEVAEVLDLPDGDASADTILRAVLHRPGAALIECPVRPPMCGQARLALTRDRSLLLLAVARQGLADLRNIGESYRWLLENRVLVAMAVPQLAIDPHSTPRVHLLVDETDLTADILRPMLHAASVSIQAYRRLRWGGKIGLLLSAA